jgi:UDP:flavonoid glycosyltransferase YjiC (YdhE family)
MATAGFTLITESLHLRKPYLALPMSGQFEQVINAIFLEKLGCGINLQQVTPQSIGDFLYRLPEFEAALAGQPSFDNRLLLRKMDALLADDAKEARRFHRERKQLSAAPEAGTKTD